MKKANKKISKLLKVVLLLCMIFSQLASPIETLAAEIVPSYNIDMVLDTENDKFVVTSNGTKELVEDENYILEITRSFKYADGVLNEEENKTTYELVLGSSLTTGVEVAHETFSYNGTSYIDINVYEITTEDTIDFSTYTDEDYQTLLTTENVENIMETSFEEGVSYNNTALTFEVLGDGVVCDTTEGYKCNVTKLFDNEELGFVANNVVVIKYATENGDLNPNKTYHTVLKVNSVVSDLVSGDLELDFSKMLPGVYNVEYSVRDENNNEVLENSVEFTFTSEEEIDRLEFVKNSEISDEVFYSYSTLTDEEKNTLGNEYRFLDNPLAFVIDSLVSENESVELSTDYNLFVEDNRYHVVTSERFLGAFYEGYDAAKVSDVKTGLALLQLPHTIFMVVDANGNEVSDTTYVQNGMKLVVTILGEKVEYDFLVHGDVDGGYVETSDLNELINKVINNSLSYYDTYNFDFNADGVIDITDISVLGVNIFDGDYTLYDFSTVDVITPVIESETEELYENETFEVLVSLNGFTDDYINTIEGYVNYDSEALRLDSVECLDEYFVGSYLENRFVYATNETYATNEEGLIKLTFTALVEGTHKVSLTSMNLLADGVKLMAESSNELEIKVNRALHTDASLKSLTSSVGYFNIPFNSETLDYTLYVDGYVNYVTIGGELNDEFATTDGFKTYALNGGNTLISINVTAEDGTVRTYRINVVKVYKSSNNNLSSLTIEGYDIDFDKNTLEYKITVGPDVTSLNISALVEDNSAWAKIEGNENFKEGENVVKITVYAQDGSSKTYKLLVNKEAKKAVADVEEDDETNTSNINTEKLVIIVLIVLVVIGLLYLIFKKDEDEDEIRIEQIKPKKEENKSEEQVKNNNNSNKNNHYNNKKKK